jgi:hypothetical protein
MVSRVLWQTEANLELAQIFGKQSSGNEAALSLISTKFNERHSMAFNLGMWAWLLLTSHLVKSQSSAEGSQRMPHFPLTQHCASVFSIPPHPESCLDHGQLHTGAWELVHFRSPTCGELDIYL